MRGFVVVGVVVELSAATGGPSSVTQPWKGGWFSYSQRRFTLDV